MGCGVLVERGRCATHQKQQQQQADSTRGNSAERGYDSKWRKARAGWLRSHPLCMRCDKQGQVTPASVVDHIVAHRGDMTLFWNNANWQSLCATCHNIKTATEDGGFGNKPRK
jgi:5-methylcytosine-specific restriction protein A